MTLTSISCTRGITALLNQQLRGGLHHINYQSEIWGKLNFIAWGKLNLGSAYLRILIKGLILKGDIILWTVYKEYSQEGENIHLGIACI